MIQGCGVKVKRHRHGALGHENLLTLQLELCFAFTLVGLSGTRGALSLTLKDLLPDFS